VIEELGDELLVYDLDVKHAHCLTPAAARVWRACDGRARPEVIASQLEMDLADVRHVLDELERCDLLATLKTRKNGLSRRDFGLKVTKVAAAAAAAPVILSIAAPAVAATESQAATCNAFGPAGVNDCSTCNQPTGNNTLCCCCHDPFVDFNNNPWTGGSNLKLCAADAVQCCCPPGPKNPHGFGSSDPKTTSHHCTESDLKQQLCSGVTCP
jgi:hypothetical protein